jgi:hypothetical protein
MNKGMRKKQNLEKKYWDFLPMGDPLSIDRS